MKKKKSFWDWLWNFQIRARTSRKREGCTYRQYKAWAIHGREGYAVAAKNADVQTEMAEHLNQIERERIVVVDYEQFSRHAGLPKKRKATRTSLGGRCLIITHLYAVAETVTAQALA